VARSEWPQYRNKVVDEIVTAFRFGERCPEFVAPHLKKGYVVVVCLDETKPQFKNVAVYNEAVFDAENTRLV